MSRLTDSFLNQEVTVLVDDISVEGKLLSAKDSVRGRTHLPETLVLEQGNQRHIIRGYRVIVKGTKDRR